jgi:hypothetical protein
MIVVVFQNVFCVEMYQNNFFNFLKIIFEISALKRSKTYEKINFNKKINFFKITYTITFLNDALYHQNLCTKL